MFSSFRFLWLMICVALPSAGCWGQQLHSSKHVGQIIHGSIGLHSSTNPNAWVGGFLPSDTTDTLLRIPPLKEPVIPSGNLDVVKTETDGEETTAKGTYYESGLASYYSVKVHGRMMASGERYDKNKLFCAHKKLPFGTRIRVVNKKNGKEVIVPVKDRGPYSKGRVIDLSNKAAEVIGMLGDGIVQCELWVLGKEE